MADPCPTFDPADYDIVDINDCEGFPTDTGDYEFVEFDHCEGFDFDPVDFDIIEFDMDWLPCNECCSCNCCSEYGGFWDAYQITVAGVNQVGTNCQSEGGEDFCALYYNGTFILHYRPNTMTGQSCTFSTDELAFFTPCGGADNVPAWTLACTFDSVSGNHLWALTPAESGGEPDYTLQSTDPAAFCPCGGTFTASSTTGSSCEDFPATIDVVPAPGANWINCCHESPTCGAEFAAMTTQATATKSTGRFSLECVLRGESTGETAKCKTCGSREAEVPLYQCPVYGTCTKDGTPIEGIQWCRTCPDKVLPAS